MTGIILCFLSLLPMLLSIQCLVLLLAYAHFAFDYITSALLLAYTLFPLDYITSGLLTRKRRLPCFFEGQTLLTLSCCLLKRSVINSRISSFFWSTDVNLGTAKMRQELLQRYDENHH